MSGVPVSPSVPGNYFREQAGILALTALAFRLKCVWRPTPNADLGIDGQLELISEDGTSTGKILGVQVKSGDSYIRRGNEREIHYYPEEKHRRYWADFPLPVVLALHDPASGNVCWVDARRQLRFSPAEKAIVVPRTHILNEHSKEELFETSGAFDQPLLPVQEVVRALATTTTGNPQFNLSFLDMYVLGLMDIGRKLFFSMTLCMDIAKAKSEHGVSLGNDDIPFLDRYVRFLVSQGLIYYDFYDYLIDSKERGLTPVFLCPLTARGQAALPVIRGMVQNKRIVAEHFLYAHYGSSGLSETIDELARVTLSIA